ncbi:MAG: hypothetical protein KBD31_00985 [Proteobacteria bacterium]|nr:hypothetical protein [Pseudomonadota bacterium]
MSSYSDICLQNREDLIIFDLQIKASEGELFFVEIIAQTKKIDHPFIVLLLNDTPFFKGEVFGPIQYIEPDQMKIRYRAKGPLLKPVSSSSYFKDTLYQDFMIPFIDPLTHEQTAYSPFLEAGEEVLNLTPYVLEKTLNFEEVRPIKESVHVKMQAFWEQKNTHLLNVWSLIEKQNKNSSLKTLTPNALKAMFPKIGETFSTNGFKKTGYRVFFSRLKQIKSEETFTVPLDSEEDALIPIASFKGDLILEATNCFIRQEKLFCNIQLTSNDHLSFLVSTDNDFMNPIPKDGDVITLTVDPSYLKEEEGVFFMTKDGQKAIEQGLQLAFLKVLFSKFNVLFDFKIPFEKGAFLTLGKAISITHQGREYGGKIAKIISKMNVNEATCRIWVNLFPKNIDVSSVEKAKAKIQNLIQHLKPLRKDISFDDPLSLSIDNFVTSLNIFNLYEDQISLLLNEKFKSPDNIKSFLKTIPTFFEMELLDLKNKDPIIQTYEIQQES